MTDPALSDREREALEKLQIILSGRYPEKTMPLTDEEVQMIRHMIEVYKSFSVLGRVAGFMRNVVLWLGVMFAAWYTFKDWLAGLAKGSGQ